jgi:hypothetical protein
MRVLKCHAYCVQDPKRSIFKGKGFALGKEAEAESEVVESGPARPAPKSYKVVEMHAVHVIQSRHSESDDSLTRSALSCPS